MPLPTDPNMTWPPPEINTTILPSMARWAAWWSNDLARLQQVYGGGLAIDPTGTGGYFASDRGGVKVHSVGPFRWFVGQPQVGTGQNTKIPIPIASEICQASADLLFSEPVSIMVGQPIVTKDADGKITEEKPNTTQQRLDDLLDENFHAKLAEAAESSAALGGVYLRVTFDPVTHPEGPFTTVVDADMAWPEFDLGGWLSAVTFWSVINRDGKIVYRHLERHELSATGNGVILHALYAGEEDKLGVRVSLSTLPATAALAAHDDLNVEGTIDTLSPGLAVQYIPNQTPNRMWRHDRLGRNLGRSDLDGVEHLMDQLAETMTDWMRARRVARARIMTAKELVKSSGPGQAATVNLDQETYVETSVSKGSGSAPAKLADLVEVLQPTFDPAGYAATAQALIERILEMAGYSTQTFGVSSEVTSNRTATEVESRERRSLMTRGRKMRPWKPGLREHITKLLWVDNVLFQQKNDVTDVTVEFQDGVQESQLKLAQTVQALFTSQSASVAERVRVMHQDWTEDQINGEADEIRAEFAVAPMTDPTFPPFDAPAEEPADGAAVGD